MGTAHRGHVVNFMAHFLQVMQWPQGRNTVDTRASKQILHSNIRCVSVEPSCRSSASIRCRRSAFSLRREEVSLSSEEKQLPILSLYGSHFFCTRELGSHKRSVDFRLERHDRMRRCVLEDLALARSLKRTSCGGAFRFLGWWRRTAVLPFRLHAAEGSVRATSKNALRALQRGPGVVDDLDDASGRHMWVCVGCCLVDKKKDSVM